jgi:hypothetical protein
MALRAFRDPVGVVLRAGRAGRLVVLAGGRRPTFVPVDLDDPEYARSITLRPRRPLRMRLLAR